MANVLFIKTSSLGDVIHHMPALTEARRRRPDARFAWVVEEAFAPLVRCIRRSTRWCRWRRAAGVTRCCAPRRGARSAPSRAPSARADDEVIDTQGLVRTAIISRLARGRRHGYDAASIREPLASRFYDVRHQVSRDLHAIARNRMLTGLALGYAPEGDIDFGLDRANVAGGAGAASAILLHATARPTKQWPEERWIALGCSLAARGLELLLPWGNEAERERSERIAAGVPGALVLDRRPVDELARRIAAARFVVGVDTGLLHLAAALGVPLVGIFVGSEPGLTGPRGRGPIAIVGGKGAMPETADVLTALDRLVG